MIISLIILVLVLLLGSGGAYDGPRAGWGGSHYGGGLIGLVLLILVACGSRATWAVVRLFVEP
jgi:hypothetical protein